MAAPESTEPYDNESTWSGELVDAGPAKFKVKTLPGIIELRPSWWRHPIRRWKLRHLLPDMEASERETREAVGDEMIDELHRREEEAFLYGIGGE